LPVATSGSGSGGAISRGGGGDIASGGPSTTVAAFVVAHPLTVTMLSSPAAQRHVVLIAANGRGALWREPAREEDVRITPV
jgi:hypothetical protein